MNLSFRAAKFGDIKAIVPLMYSSDARVFDYLFTNKTHTAQQFLSFALEQDQGSFGISQQIVGCLNNQIVFSGSTFEGGQTFWNMMKENAESSLLFFALQNNIEGALKGEVFKDLLLPPHSDSLFLQNMGTDPEFRGQGICKNFMHLQHERARSQKLNYCELDVGLDNPRAEKLYSSLGYVVIEEIYLQPGLVTPGIKRMRLTL